MYANSNEGMVFKIVVSLSKEVEMNPLESLPRLTFKSEKTFHLNLI